MKEDKSHTHVPLLSQPQAHLAPEPTLQACVCSLLQPSCTCPHLLPPGPALGPGSPSWLLAFLLPSSHTLSEMVLKHLFTKARVSICSRTKCGIPDALAWPLGASQAALASFPASHMLGVGGGVVVLQPMGSLSCLRASCTVAFLVDTFLFSGQDELLSALSVITLCLSLGGNTETPLSRLVLISDV